MANRIELGANGFRVSKPGVNVLTMPSLGKGVAFDSRWSNASMIVAKGTVAISSSTSPQTIPYGVTLPDVPVVFIYARSRYNSAQWRALDTYSRNADVFMRYGAGQDATAEQCRAFFRLERDPPVGIQKFNDRLVFTPSRWGAEYDLLTYIVLRGADG